MTVTPEEIHNVSQTMFSVARYSGGMKLNGQSYTYFPDRDVLVRDDVLKMRVRAARAEKRKGRR